jgi:hypothetical protein
LFRVISLVLLLLGAGVFPLFAAGAKPDRIELAESWKLASTTEAPSDGGGDFGCRFSGFPVASDSPNAGHGS